MLIRTFVVHANSITFSAGGVTVGSDPALEYAESLHKAEDAVSSRHCFGKVNDCGPR